MVLGTQGTDMRKNEVGPLPHAIYKNELKRIKDLNVRTKSIKLLEEHVGKNLYNVRFGSDFLDKKPKAQIRM